jgi:hypothetical protein
MAPAIPSKMVAKRRAMANAEIARLTAQIGACHTAIETWRAQLADLEVAERVWATLEQETAQIDEGAPTAAEARSNRKPQGLPSMPEMILETLRDARRNGLNAMEPKQMATRIARRWWPDVKITDVGPIAWRMWKKQGVLDKSGSGYVLPADQHLGEFRSAVEAA